MKKRKAKYINTTADIIKENERLIKIAETLMIILPIIYIVLIIAWIYFKSIGD